MKSVKDILFLMGSVVIILITGYGIHVHLSKYLKPDYYGLYNIIMGALLCVEYFIAQFFPKAIQNMTAKLPNEIAQIKKFYMKKQLYLCLFVSFLLFLCADYFANSLNDARLSIYIRIALWDIPFYGFYVFFLVFSYGLGNFRLPSIIMTFWGIVKFIIVFSIIKFQLDLGWIFIGNIMATCFGLLLSSYWMPRTSDGRIQEKKYPIAPFFYIALFQLCVYILIYSDLFMIKRLIGDNDQVGVYAVAANIARIICYIFFQLALYVFSVLSKALYHYDRKAVNHYMKVVLLFIFMGLLPLCLGISYYARHIVALLFPPAYISAGPLLSCLILSLMFIVISVIYMDMISVLHSKISLGLCFMLVVMNVVLCQVYIPEYQLFGAVIAMMYTGGIGVVSSVIIWYYILNRYFKKGKVLAPP